MISLTALLPMFASAMEVACESMTVELNEKWNGTVTRVVTAGGVELAATRDQLGLFSIKATRTDDYEKSVTVQPGKGTTCAMTPFEGGARLVYTGFGEAVEKVVCTVRPDGRKLRWNIGVEPKPGWAIEQTAYPRILTAERIGACGADDAVVVGTAKGGVRRDPTKRRCCLRDTMPGSLVCQFACHYDDSALFYYAAEDGRGHAKELCVEGVDTGVKFSFAHVGFDVKPFRLPYDIVTAAIDGTRAKPTLWQDAADLYREWARRQSWCTPPLRVRPDLPRWMKDAPSLVRFTRSWLADPGKVRRWIKDYWQKFYPKSPLVTAFWGWEKHGDWVSDYFPVYPSDEAFAALVKDLRAVDAHAFPWPSGYYWVLDYDKRADGTFAFTDYANYQAANGDAYCCINRDGKPYRRHPRWLNGGTSTCLCGGTQFCQDWWNKGICQPLAKLGCELIQIDQNVGGAFRPCWSREHGHMPGDGLWKHDVFRRQLVTMRETMRAVEPDSVVCYEEPCEIYNDLVGIQDYRTCEARSDEWASVFNYVYHEYLPCFQSNPRRYERVWQAHSAADGQMPHLTPSDNDLLGERKALANGDFERLANGNSPFAGWDRLSGYKGVAWNGRAFADAEVRHGGGRSLRIECAKGETNVQVAQNVIVDGQGFRVGGKYRLSAWVKTGRGTCRIASCFLGGGSGNVGEMAFPKPAAEWALVTNEFTVANGVHSLRIMISAKEGSVGWVDSMTLEEVLADGTTKEAIVTGRDFTDRFMRSWVSVYHGRGRDWLAHGRQIRPPVIDCAMQPFKMSLYGGAKFEGMRPTVFNSAWEAPDGRKALVFVNATGETQPIGYRWKGETRRMWVQPDVVTLVED